MVVIDTSALVEALLVAGPARGRLATDSLQAPELIDAELLSVLRRLVLAGHLLAHRVGRSARNRLGRGHALLRGAAGPVEGLGQQDPVRRLLRHRLLDQLTGHLDVAGLVADRIHLHERALHPVVSLFG